MLLKCRNGTDWTQAKKCKDCGTLPQIKCSLEWIELTCPICEARSITAINHGTQVAIEDWNKYHTEDWYK